MLDDCWWLLALALVGCGSSDDSGGTGAGGFPAGTTCGVSVALSGGLEQILTPNDSVACTTQLSSGAGIEAGFIPLTDGPVEMVTVSVDDVEKGKTGTGFPAELRIQRSDGKVWHALDCSADISEHAFDNTDDFAEHYRAAGSGSCSGPATSSGEPDVTVSEFAFVAVFPWTKN